MSILCFSTSSHIGYLAELAFFLSKRLMIAFLLRRSLSGSSSIFVILVN